MSGVGVIGAGPGVGALHLPTSARFAERFPVVHVADAGGGRAAGLASRTAAAHSEGIDALLADARVDVVVVASPPHLHAQHVLAAIAAGKRAVLCEKPLALTRDDVDEVIAAAQAAGTALIVGTNHLFDPAWGRAKHHVAGAGRVRSISITAALPPNGRYHDVVTDTSDGNPAPARPPLDLGDPDVAAGLVRQLVLGLVVHDLPLVRDLVHGAAEVVYARALAPVGCALGFTAGGVLVQIDAVLLPAGAEALWRMAVATTTDQFELDFPPSFVHAGGARVRVLDSGGRTIEYPPDADDGYLAEWRALAAAIDGTAAVELEDLREDALFAIDLADAAAAAARAGATA